MWTVYVLECADGSLYTGVTTDPVRRLAEHNSGRGAKALRGRLPCRIVHTERCRTRAKAQSREALIKSWPRSKKLELVRENA